MYPTNTGSFAKPEMIASHFHLREGDVVADFGAGSGHYMKILSDAVGRTGKVYMCEIQKNLVDKLGIHAQEQRLTNVHPIWCDLEAPQGTKLKDALLDAALISNTMFQFEDKGKALTETARVLRKGGKLFIVDWTGSFGGLGPHPEQVVNEYDARKYAEDAGFTFEHSFPAGDHHYGIVLRKK